MPRKLRPKTEIDKKGKLTSIEKEHYGREYSDWREKVERSLLAAGVVGKKQHELCFAARHQASSEEVVNHRNALLVDDRVQKFIVPQEKGGPKATIWRATTKLMEDDDVE